MFILKKTISVLLMPLPLAVILCLAGLALLWFNKRPRMARILISLGMAVLIICGSSGFAHLLMSPLESSYPKYDTSQYEGRNIGFVVVLGGGHNNDPRWPTSSQLNATSLVRLTEGITIYRQHPGSKLVLSGWSGDSGISNADMMKRIALNVGVEASDIITEPRPRDTAEEANYIKPLVGDANFVLVTSASHLPRAMRLFQSAGMDPIAAPTAFQSSPSSRTLILPRVGYISQSKQAIHEYVGQIWSRLRGEIK